MYTVLHQLGRSCAARPWRVIGLWLTIMLAATAMSVAVGGTYRDEMSAPGTSSAHATDRLRTSFPAAANAQAHVVAHWDDPPPSSGPVLSSVVADLRALPQVAAVDTRHNPDGTTVMVAVTYDRELPDLDAPAITAQLTSSVAALEHSGADVGVGGPLPESIQGPNVGAEAVGVVVAALVLVLAFGSVLAAGPPLLIAGASLGVGLALIAVLARFTELTSVAPTLGAMIGLGVGIDYALLVVTRHQEAVRAGVAPVDAAAHTVATAGGSVLMAAVCVLFGLSGLAFSGVPGFAWMGVAAALVVAVTAAAAITLLPALLGLIGRRVLSRRARRSTTTFGQLTARTRWTGRVIGVVLRRPVYALLASLVVLLALAAPALSMRLGQSDAGSEPTSSPTRLAYDLMADSFGPGANGPLLVVADTSGQTSSALAALTESLRALPGVARVGSPVTSENGKTSVFAVTPTTGPQEAATADLVHQLNTEVLPAGTNLTGPTAAALDTSDVLAAHLWQVIFAVLAATFVLLVLVFRSLVLPIKAVLANLLSVGASYGVLTLAFQTHLGAALIGLSEPVPIAAWAPIVLFAILFGLSMDYEVFMLSAVHEQHLAGASSRDSLVRGMASTSRTIICAAAIMVAVALGFALDPSVVVKIIGVGLASAIIVDVTLVRMILVPAAMTLMGQANWWLPAWLERRLPTPTDPAGRCPFRPEDRLPSELALIGPRP
ncbi:MAG: MMPL family transporter [Nocardioidaceae bacterium]